ncbi:MAG: SusC/RagA family TonB-linked outer membrane protein [Rikenellaceae bacterium]
MSITLNVDENEMEEVVVVGYGSIKAKDLDWVGKMSNSNPIQQTHTLSISGRKNNSGYYVSFNIADQEGLLINSGFNRYQGRISLDQYVNDNVKFGINASYAQTNTWGDTATGSSSSANAFMNRVYESRPTSWDEESLYNLEYQILDGSNGETWSYAADNYNPWPSSAVSSFGEQYRYNPVVNSYNIERRKTQDQLTSSAYLEIYFLEKALTLKLTGGYTLKKTETISFNNDKSYSGTSDSATGLSDGANGSLANATSSSLLSENTLTYQKVINNDHSINALLGFSIQQDESESHSFSATQVPDSDLGVAALDSGTLSSSTSTGSISSLLSIYGRINYAYKSKYIATLTIRRDGSSKFAESGKWGSFPSGALAWRITEEDFMQPVKKVMNDAKLRASFGISGNNRVGDFASQALMTTATGDRYSFGNEMDTYGTYPSTIANEGLTWETTRTWDFGVELSFFKNRLKLEVDYYIKNTYDLLMSSTLATNCGYSSMTRNVGEISNKGLELAVNTVNIDKKGFLWTSTFNISFNKNRLESLASGEKSILSNCGYLSDSHIARVGEPVSQFYGYVGDGFYQEQDFECLDVSGQSTEQADGTYRNAYRYLLNDNVPYITSKLVTLPGSKKFIDLNGDGTIDSNDQTVIGSPYPKHSGSLANRFSYKGFELNVYFTYSYGNQIINGTMYSMWNTADSRRFGYSRFSMMADYWTRDNNDAKYQSLVANGQRNLSNDNLEDGSYLRLKTVSLTYTVPKKIVSKLGLTNVRVSYSAQNLWTLTNYSGQDPEVNVGYSALTPGYDNAAYPRTSTNSVNLTITL